MERFAEIAFSACQNAENDHKANIRHKKHKFAELNLKNGKGLFKQNSSV
jgi:hypothetical protein